MGVGPPRFGLLPGVGKKPGRDPDRAHAELRYIEFPGTDEYPGRGLRTVIRWATVPSTTLYPATNRFPRGAPETFSRVLTFLGGALQAYRRVAAHRFRRLTQDGSHEQRFDGIVHGPSFLLGKIPTVVEFSQPTVYAEMALINELVELDDGYVVVEL